MATPPFDPTFALNTGFNVGSPNSQDEFAGYGHAFLNEDQFVLEMDKNIHMISPSAAPFLSWASMVRKRVTPQYVYSWMMDELFTHRDTKALLVRSSDGLYTLRMLHGGDWQAFEAVPLADAKAGFDALRPSLYVEIKDTSGNAVHFLPMAQGLSEGPGGYSYVDDSGDTVKLHGEIVLLDNTDGGGVVGGNSAMSDYEKHVFTKDTSGDTQLNATNLNAIAATAGSFEVNVHVYTPDEQLKGYAQGSGLPNETRKRSRSDHNFTQIFKTPYSIANTLKAVKLYGGPELARLRLRKAIQHKVELERAILFQGGGVEGTHWGELPMDGAENPLTRFKGLGVGITDRSMAGFIVTKNAEWDNRFKFKYKTATIASLNTLLDGIFDDTVDNPATTKVVFASKRWMLALSQMAANFDSTSGAPFFGMRTQQGNKLGLTIKELESPVGNLRFVPMPLFRGQYEDYALVLDMSRIEIRPLQTRDTKLLANVGDMRVDGQQDYYLTEMGFEAHHESTAAILKLDHTT